MEVIKERTINGIYDEEGSMVSSIDKSENKYQRGKEILEQLLQIKQPEIPIGYSAFVPTIDTFLKEHLFADIFERDILSYSERELVTISVISTITKAEPMLKSHLSICLNLGFTSQQLYCFANIIKINIGKKEAKAVQKTLEELLKNYK